MDGRALISLISSVILGFLFVYAVVCAARIYTADRRGRLGENQGRSGWLDWCPGRARRLAVGAVALLTILALAVTAASWSLGSRPLRALLHRLEGIGAARGKEALSRPEAIFVWNGRVMEAPAPGPRSEAPPASRPERRSGDPARARDQSAGLAPERELAMGDEKPASVKRVASRVERFERAASVGSAASVERVERTRTERSSRPERAARIERPERVVRVERAERPEKPERSGRAERPERVTRQGR